RAAEALFASAARSSMKRARRNLPSAASSSPRLRSAATSLGPSCAELSADASSRSTSATMRELLDGPDAESGGATWTAKGELCGAVWGENGAVSPATQKPATAATAAAAPIAAMRGNAANDGRRSNAANEGRRHKETRGSCATIGAAFLEPPGGCSDAPSNNETSASPVTPSCCSLSGSDTSSGERPLD